MRSSHAWRPFTPGILGVLVLVLSFSSVFLTDYGWNDDFNILLNTHNGAFTYGWNIFNASGRPLLGAIILFSFRLVDSLSGLQALRGIGLAGALLTVFTLWRICRRLGYGSLFSAVVPCLMILTPAFGVLVGWAVCFPYPSAAALALLAGWLAWIALDQPGKGRKSICGVGSLLLLLATELIYQPIGGFFFLPPIMAAMSRQAGRPWLLRWFVHTLIFCTTLLVYYVLYKVSLALWWGDHFIVGQRTGLNFDLLSRLAELARGPVLKGLQSWFVFWEVPILGTILFSFLITISLLLRLRQGWSFLGILFLLIISTVLMHAPVIVTSDHHLPYRIFSSWHATVVFLGCGVFHYLHTIPVARKLAQGVLLGWLGLAGWATHTIVTDNMAEPYAAEVETVWRAFEKTFQENELRTVLFILPEWEARAPFYRYPSVYEYGISPFINNFAIDPFVKWKVSRIKDNGSFNASRVIAVHPHQFHGNGHLPVVDYSNLFLREPTPARKWNPQTAEPFWNTSFSIRELAMGWYFSPEFGYLQERGRRGYYHTHLGMTSYLTSASGGDWLAFEKIGRCWITREAFPIVYQLTEKRWIYLELSPDGYQVVPLQ